MLAAKNVAAALGLSYSGAELEFTGITTDSRNVKPGELFIALVGEIFDGHDHCLKALEAGAKGVVISKDVKLPEGTICYKVQDTLKALQDIAGFYRQQFEKLTVIGLTGSNGKTSTKDYLAACLAVKYNVVKTQGNFNNEIGLPKTLLNIQPDTDIAVVEMGMRGLGQIAALCAIAKPDSGLITNVGETHMELLGSMENIGLAKSEIVENLTADGFAVLNGDNAYVMKAKEKTAARVVTFGFGESCDYRGEELEVAVGGTCFTCVERATGKRVRVRLAQVGQHNAYNALAAMAMSACYGVTIEASAAALAAAQLSGARQQMVQLQGITFINDSYNASPASMDSALKILHETKKGLPPGSKAIAVLADMLELGAVSQNAHERVGRWAVDSGADAILAYGQEASYLVAAALQAGGMAMHFADRDTCGEELQRIAKPGDVVLLKGSNSMGVGKLLELFK